MSRVAVMSWMCIFWLAGVVAAQASGQFPYTGRVSGNDVNVRCGPDTNYYPTMRLSTGAAVTVVGEEFGWLKIEPPPGSFCLIAKDYVDRDRDGSAVVSSDHVNVRAGSTLSSRRLPITQLSKGAVVKILGEHQDGFYKIAPPPGAYLWIAKQFVRQIKQAARPKPDVGKPPAVKTSQSPTATQPTERAPTSKPAEGKYQKLLDKLEAELEQETTGRPLTQWNLKPLLPRYEQIAKQDDEQVAKLFAQQRLKIIGDRIEIQQALKRIREGGEKLQDQRRRILQQRLAMRAKVIQLEEPFEAEGEIRKSWVFKARYRLVNPQDDRTVAYLEPGQDWPDPGNFLGRYVGIRAASKYLEGRLWILVPSEITLLERPTKPAETEEARTD